MCAFTTTTCGRKSAERPTSNSPNTKNEAEPGDRDSAKRGSRGVSAFQRTQVREVPARAPPHPYPQWDTTGPGSSESRLSPPELQLLKLRRELTDGRTELSPPPPPSLYGLAALPVTRKAAWETESCAPRVGGSPAPGPQMPRLSPEPGGVRSALHCSDSPSSRKPKRWAG